MLDEFQKAFAEYKEKMKHLATSLEDEAYHLQQVAENCSQVAIECATVGESIREIESDGNSDANDLHKFLY